MRRFAVSASYTAAAFLAALAVVVLVVRTSGVEDQAKFFYFQAIYFVLSTIVSQFLTLMTFRNMPARRAGLIADAVSLVAVVVFLQLPFGFAFTALETVFYALATVLLYRGSALIISVQFFSRNSWRWLWAPLVALVLRIAAAWSVAEHGPAAIFLANGLAAFVVPMVILFGGLLRQDRERDAPRGGAGASSAAIFGFFLVGSFTFQWERVLYGMLESTESLLVTGYVMTVVLPPLSALFATLYRGNAREIFAQQDSAVQRRRFIRIGGAYAGLSLWYLVVLILFWPQIMGLLGAEIVPEVMLVPLLGLAIVMDRLANLLVFLSAHPRSYTRASWGKGLLLALACGTAFAIGFDRPDMNYLVFVALSLGYFASVALRRRSDAG